MRSGFERVERINGLLTDLALKAGYKDLSSFRAALNGDPKYIPKSADQIVEDFRRYVGQMQPRLPELFGVFPKTPLTVEAAPASQPNNPTHYIFGTPDGTRPARVVVATSNYAHRKLLSDETQAYHEGIPGHHLQISIQQRLTGLPEFRLHVVNNAYAEGWAVYAEALGKEIGFFQDPASDYGRLNLELMRAVRLVVDTGIHSEGWTREQAVAYFRESGAGDEPTIQAEINRYIAWPAQGLSYQIGKLKILDLRDRANSSLVRALISEPSMMKSSAEEASRSTCWKPASISWIGGQLRVALPDKVSRLVPVRLFYSAGQALSRRRTSSIWPK